MTRYVAITCIMAAMGGLNIGYDIGISGGVTSMDPFLKLFFPSVYRKEALDTSTNQYCKFDSQLLTLFTSSLYEAAFFTSFVASSVSKKHGRKVTMFLGGLFFLLGALLNAAAVHISMLILGRILIGIGVGFANQSVPIFICLRLLPTSTGIHSTSSSNWPSLLGSWLLISSISLVTRSLLVGAGGLA